MPCRITLGAPDLFSWFRFRSMRRPRGIELTNDSLALGIRISQLAFVPAWQVGPSSPLLSAMRGINDPVVPPGVKDAPFLRAKERLEELQRRSNG